MNFGNGKPALSNKDQAKVADSFEDKINVSFVEGAQTKVGYLANIKQITLKDETGELEDAAVLLYFIEPNGSWFKARYIFNPYFYVLCDDPYLKEVVFALSRQFEKELVTIDEVAKEDLNLINHLSGKTQKYIRLVFRNLTDLSKVRFELHTQVKKNRIDRETQNAYEGWHDAGDFAKGEKNINFLSKILDIREYDVSFHIRVMIDREFRCSLWYSVALQGPVMQSCTLLKEMLDKADLRIMAFDIETTKQPLKFPDVKFDQVMMISYIIDGSGYLITNRQIVGDDVTNFEYAPREDYDCGEFKVFNEENERALLVKFFAHIVETKPTIFTTYNGDNFDWPFIQARADVHKIKMEDQIGIFNNIQGEFSGRFASHMDCLYWVKRDAYLPQGSHGLKKVTKAKLGYDPVELDPELMVQYAKEKPQQLAEYSVSDSVATYFLYMQQIHDFIFALCTIIPTNPDEVLRRGSGTLCEDLLMAQAFRGNIIFPNKQEENPEKFCGGKLIDTETYIGGHVECLQQGVYRSDFPVEFKVKAAGYQSLIDIVDKIIDFSLETEPGNVDKHNIINYDEVKNQIVAQLTALRNQCPVIKTEPLIYHVDVAAMYPNIILSNRLQPVAIVNDKICAGCVFNKDSNNCKRKLDWQWKGEIFPIGRGEFEQIKLQLNEEEKQSTSTKAMNAQENQAYALRLKTRVKKYCSTVYKNVHKEKIEHRTDTVCMRENPFYVDTVRDFRDRRYDFKRLVKVWGGKYKDAVKGGDPAETETCKNRVALYESLQLAHKIILNSFYGYVMRRGARWYSMEMAAMVTHTGGEIIKDSRELYEQIGMPLELDTDGIWTLLPRGFPEQFTFKLKDGSSVKFDFPCTMSNQKIYDKYANNQYQTLADKEKGDYDTRTEMSIFFEIDGPYKCMLIPASTEENKMLKKRYAVFNHAGKMTEVKGFELKRRGELQIVKIFQEEVFTKFLSGNTIQECYDACGEVADRWYDILLTKGSYVDQSDLIEYIAESRVISKTLDEYGALKSTSITCAKRLAEFLGSEAMQGKGINVKFIISKKPLNEKVAGRAIPTVIFDAEEATMKKFLRKWTGDNGMTDYDLRSILDWDYYKDRLAGTIQKIVTIPAALQNCMNPVPRIEYPDWLIKRIKIRNNKFKQKKMENFFKVGAKPDIEDLAKSFPKITVNKINLKTDEKPQKDVLNFKDCPDPDTDFKQWLKHQKQNWRSIRKELGTEKKIVNKKVGLKNTALTNFIRNMDDMVLNSNWHVIKIDQTFQPGILRVWALTQQGSMFNVKLQVGRKVYINSKTVNQDSEFKKVQKELPRNRKVHHLYEWETSEENFQQKFNNIKYTHLMSNDTEGIYETKVPPKFRALMEMGSIVRPRRGMIPKNEQALGRVYKISELENKPFVAEDQQYLPEDSFDQVYLCHTQAGSRHFWGLFLHASSEIYFYVVGPVGKQSECNLEFTFSKVLTDTKVEVEFAAWQVVDQKFYSDSALALKAIESRLQDYKSKHKGATILVLQSDYTPEQLQFMGMPTLINEFPVLRCKTEKSDSIDLQNNHLGWVRGACANMTLRFIEMPDWVETRIGFSRYTFIPVCNLTETDMHQNMIDILYARQLNQSKHLIWYSDTSMPDLGGHEDRSCRIYFQDDIESPEWEQKGFYRNYSIELSVACLPQVAILNSEFLQEFQDATKMQQGINTGSKQKNENYSTNQAEFDNDLDEFVTCAASFEKLKMLMKFWLKDIVEGQSVQADDLISHFYRWLTNSTGSKLYDPLLHRLIHKMMKKHLQSLVFELKQLGCQVVFGSFHKLIVATRKETFAEAERHINFVLTTIEGQDKFRNIKITPVEYWKILLFKDKYNFAGIKESDPDKIKVDYDVMNHLPEAVQRKFQMSLCQFVLKVHNHNQSKHENVATEARKVTSMMDQVEDFQREPDHEFICELISEKFSSKLMSQVDDLVKYRKLAMQDEQTNGSENSDSYGEESEGGADIDNNYEKQRKLREKERKKNELQKWEFPQRISSHHNYLIPALEFSKMICHHVFGVDQAFQAEANVLLRNLLTWIHQKEFSKEVTEGIEPSLILVVPDVICEVCQAVFDLDICRNSMLQEAKEEWPCENCGENALNQGQVERRLIQILNRRVITYQMQDLKCKACRMVNNSLVSRHCQCTATFNQTLGNVIPEKLKNQNLMNQMTDIRLFVKLLRNFAQKHQMLILQNSAQMMLEAL